MLFHSPLTCSTPDVVSAVCCLVLVVVLVCFSFKRGASYIEWAYHIGDQPVYRLLFLLVLVFTAQHRTFFPVALLLALLFMVINNMVPMLTNLDETFVFGAPLVACKAYSAEDVQAVGTPFYPLNVYEKESVDGGDGVGLRGDKGIPDGLRGAFA